MAPRYFFGRVTQVPGQGFVGIFPDIPDFSVSGNSVDEVKEKAEIDLTPFLKEKSEKGHEIPEPKTELYTTPHQKIGESRILVAGDIPNETPALLILRNAQRLIKEARILHRSGSMATTVALSISAIEEAGKLIIFLTQDQTSPKKGRADHRDKQKVLATHFEKIFLVEALEEVDRDYENHLRKSGDQEQLVEFLSMSRHERFSFVYSVLSEDKGLLRRTIQRVAGPDEHSINFKIDVDRNKVSEKREQSLYVDYREGRLSPTPFDISFDEANEWLERADFAISLAQNCFQEHSNGP